MKNGSQPMRAAERFRSLHRHQPGNDVSNQFTSLSVPEVKWG
jgi:hypothetical protein